jgi:hypothetical protein
MHGAKLPETLSLAAETLQVKHTIEEEHSPERNVLGRVGMTGLIRAVP